MCNQMITTENYNTQMTLLPEIEEKKTPKRQLAPTFQRYDNRQIQVICDLEACIPEHHVARVVDEMVEAVPDEKLFSHYKGGGRSSFHPKMMLKILLFGYSQKVYSCRGIEKLINENIPAMWLAAMHKPDFRTINEFRGVRMKPLMDELFEAMILQLINENYITMENYFLDGTKIEANANKYSFIWKKATAKFEEKLHEKIQETLEHIHELTHSEAEPEPQRENIIHKLETIAEKMEEKVEEFNVQIKKETDVELRKNKRQERARWKKPVKLIRENFLPRLAKYKEQNAIFGDRNSYSKTDKDATFMRMKEDHMKNGQLKPGYNVQMGTENQFILYYTIHQRPTDTRCFIPHLEKLAASSLPVPKTVIADAGYGSEENYVYAVGEEKKPRFDFLIPYGAFMQEQTRKYKKDIKNAKNWEYREQEDCFICPEGRKVPFKKYQNKKNQSGYEQCFKIYECEDCTDCPLKASCTKAKGNRSFRKFSLRGLDKVHVEFGIVALAHNLLKVAGIRQLLSAKLHKNKKAGGEKLKVSLHLLYFLDLLDSPSYFAWQRPTLTGGNPQLPSALKSLTSVFGMGTGVTSSPLSPSLLLAYASLLACTEE